MLWYFSVVFISEYYYTMRLVMLGLELAKSGLGLDGNGIPVVSQLMGHFIFR